MPIETQAYVARPAPPDSSSSSSSHDNIALETIHYSDIGAHEILVEIVGVSMCHTDVRAAAGNFYVKPPMILGHEGAGYVREIGSGVSNVEPGDAVILSFASCGACRRCLTGRNSYCDRLVELNFSGKRHGSGAAAAVASDSKGEALNGFFFGQSSMAKLTLAHACCAVRVECTTAELRKFAALGCGVQTGAGAIFNVLKPPAQSTLAVFGAGAVGLSACLAAALHSPALLILVDNSATKLAMLPATLTAGIHILDASGLAPDEVAAQLKALTPAGRGLDYALECVGAPAVVSAAHAALAPGGTLLQVGGGTAAAPDFPLSSMIVRGLTWRGTHQGDSVPGVMIPFLIGLWRAGRFPFDLLLTEFGWGEVGRAIDEVHHGRCIKPLLVM